MTKKNFLGYYGVPSDMTVNGTAIADSNEFCISSDSNAEWCQPLTKLFFLQFQWFPFYLALLSTLFYIPYLVYRKINDDTDSLKVIISKQNPNMNDIIRGYFNRNVNTLNKQHLKIVLNILVKVAYFLSNILSFVFTDSLLNGGFSSFGSRWLEWSDHPNELTYNYVGIRKLIKAGESLLPVFGFCDVWESGMDIKHTVINEHRFVCEISQHILYHYVLIALWFLLIIGMVISIIGLLLKLVQYVIPTITFSPNETAAKEVYQKCSLREREYLNFIHKNNLPFYGELVRKLIGAQKDENEPLIDEEDDCEQCAGEGMPMQKV